jgi:biopolymer transport protein TolQ
MNELLPQAQPMRGPLDMIVGASPATLIVLGVLVLFSVLSLWVIISKVRHFRAVRQEGDRFLGRMEEAGNLTEASEALIGLPESPYTRLFRGGLSFFAELSPGALFGSSKATGLSLTQLEALRLVMDKVEAEEIDELAHGLNWLAIIGSVSPLLGLMGTVIGIMNTFLGIAAERSTNISAVAPGVAEALITTVAGLSVAIPSVIAYNHFVSRLNLVRGEFEGFASEFIGTLAKERHV